VKTINSLDVMTSWYL